SADVAGIDGIVIRVERRDDEGELMVRQALQQLELLQLGIRHIGQAERVVIGIAQHAARHMDRVLQTKLDFAEARLDDGRLRIAVYWRSRWDNRLCEGILGSHEYYSA